MIRIVSLFAGSLDGARRTACVFAAALFCAAGVAFGDEGIDFDAKIASILSRHCLECHGGATQEVGSPGTELEFAL